MTRLVPLTPDALDRAQHHVYASIVSGRRASRSPFLLRRPDGSLTGPFDLMVRVPSVGGPLSSLGEAIRFDTSLSDREREIAVLAVAALLDSTFERYAHERVAAIVGLTRVEIEALAEPAVATFDDVAEAEILDLVTTLVTGAPIDEARYQELERRLGSRKLVEVVALVGYYRLLADLLSLFDIGEPSADERDTGGNE
jgi:4-carboxymuconolactone decarboxylase